MITLSYKDETGRLISMPAQDWEAVNLIANTILNAPIDVEYLEYNDNGQQGVFNLNTFERC